MRRPRLFGASLVCCVLLVGSAKPASAELITFQFDGVLAGVPAELAGDFGVGDAFSYTLGIDMASLFNGSYTPWQTFDGHVGSWDFHLNGGGTFYAPGDSILGELHHYQPTLINAPAVGATDQYRALGAFSTWNFAPGALTPGVLNGSDPLPLPTSATLRFLFAYRPDRENAPLLWVNGPQITLTATTIATRVPEPSTLLMLLTALGAVAGQRSLARRRLMA